MISHLKLLEKQDSSEWGEEGGGGGEGGVAHAMAIQKDQHYVVAEDVEKLMSLV